MINKINMSELGWNSIGVGLGFFLVCIGISTTRSGNISLEAANVKLQATKSLNEARQINEDTEQLVQRLQLREQAYSDLKEQYGKLSHKYEQLKLLEPQIDKIEALGAYELENIESELELTDKELTDEINQLTGE